MNKTMWLQEEVMAGLSLLMGAFLPNRPGQYAKSKEESLAEAKTATRTWATALETEYTMLTPAEFAEESCRLQIAFRSLLCNCTTWPAPAALLQELKKQGPRKPIQQLTEPPPSPEERARGLQTLAEIQKMLARKQSL